MITLQYNTRTSPTLTGIPTEWQSRVSVVRRMAGQLILGYIVKISVDVEDSSYRYRSLMQRPQLVLKFNLPYFVEFPVGTSCTFQGQTFILNSPENLKKQGTKKIEYSMTLGTAEDNLGLYKLRNSVDGRLKWSMCAKPHEFIEEICKTLNDRDGEGTWLFNRDHIIEATEKTIEFNHVYCDAALSSVAETFETEYEVIDNGNGTFEIALHKVEYFKEDPLPLSYGKGNGFVPGVGRTTEADGKPIKRLYVQGGDRNIDRSQYGEMFNYSNNPAELRLPKSQSLEYEGRTYTTDAEGYYIERTDKVSTATKEDSLDCSETYPSYVGTVSSVTNPKPEKNFYDIIDTNIPDNLNFNNYIIEGESMTLIFQTGMLAGREFEVKYKHDDKRWELVPMDEDGITFPNDTFKPNTDPAHPDTYAVFGIMLPKEYICNDTNKSGAAWDMFREAARYLYEHEEQKFTFSGELQALYAKRNWLKIGGYMKIGAYIHFTDNQFAVDGLDIRIIGVKDYINAPYAPTLEISNSIQSPTTTSSQLQSIDNAEIYTDEAKRAAINFTKRRFRDAKETAEMLEKAMLDNFSGGINPITVQTMSALIGDESLQFKFMQLRIIRHPQTGVITTTLVDVSNPISYNNNTHTLVIPSGLYLRHLTLGIKKISSERSTDSSDYKTWTMATFIPPVMAGEDMASKGYFLYARCAKEDYSDGSFILSETAISMESENGYYHFLVGILTSMQEGERSFSTLYGFTEILPGRITTDVITSGSGESWFNLAEDKFKLGDRLLFNIDDDNQLVLNGTLVQSDSGAVSPLPCFRGVYDANTYYYLGDVVTYTSNGNTTSYICMSTTAIKGVTPDSSTTKWKVYSQGTKGDKGDKGNDGTNGTNGTNGKNGLDAPILVFRGNFNDRETYYGNDSRIDAVKLGSTFYISQRTAPNGTAGFVGKVPEQETTEYDWNDYWKSFGASFDSVATSLLLAEKATIGNWFISGDNIASTHGTVNGVESNDFTHANFRPDVILDGASGELVLYSDKYPRVRISNQSVKTLFTESVLKTANINRTFTQSNGYYLYNGGVIIEQNIGKLGTIDLGYMNEDSVIKISDYYIKFVVPAKQESNQYPITCTVNGSWLRIVVKKNGTVVKTHAGGSGSTGSTGDTIKQHQGSEMTYTVPTGGAGTYTLEVYLDKIGYTCEKSGIVSNFTITANVTGSYEHGGFNRTVIGNDGIGSFWDNAIFKFSKDGFETRFGKIGFKVSDSGIQKSANANTESPTWTSI